MLIDVVAPSHSSAARTVDVGIDVSGLRDVPGSQASRDAPTERWIRCSWPPTSLPSMPPT